MSNQEFIAKIQLENTKLEDQNANLIKSNENFQLIINVSSQHN
jgi:hypothetical protein